MSFETALAVVKRKRACVKPNFGFMKALQEWDVACHGIGRSGGAFGDQRNDFGVTSRRFYFGKPNMNFEPITDQRYLQAL